MPLVLAEVNLESGLEDAWANIATFVPKLIAFLAILFIGYFVAKAIGRVVDGVLERVGFDNAVERGGIRQALARSKYDASDIVGKLVFYTLFLFVLQFAFSVFGDNAITDMISGVIAFLPKLFVAIAIVVIAAAIAAGVKDIVGNALSGLSYGPMLGKVAGVSILVIGVFAALNQVEIAPEIVNGLFYGLLAVVVGSAIIAIGGGGIQPMRARWERALSKVEDEAPKIRDEARTNTTPAPSRTRTVEVDLREQTQTETPAPVATPGATQDTIREELRSGRRSSS